MASRKTGFTKEFDTDAYQVLLVANKYQTGFDQPKLCAMYVLKKLQGRECRPDAFPAQPHLRSL